MSENKNNSAVHGIVTIVVITGLVWYFFGGGLEKHAARNMQQIRLQVAIDAVKQYEIAKRSGTARDARLRASLAAEAYLQAKDEANYRKWKDIEETEEILLELDIP